MIYKIILTSTYEKTDSQFIRCKPEKLEKEISEEDYFRIRNEFINFNL